MSFTECYATCRQDAISLYVLKTYKNQTSLKCNIKCYIKVSQDMHMMPPLLSTGDNFLPTEGYLLFSYGRFQRKNRPVVGSDKTPAIGT
jgi:hypothetical protein